MKSPLFLFNIGFPSSTYRRASGHNGNMTSILIAVDKFKGSLSGAELTDAIAEGLRAELGTDAEILTCPIADGGDGTVDAAISAGFTERTVEVAGPFGDPVTARYALSDAGVAVLEVAEACGLWRAEKVGLDTWNATSFGVGEMITDALDAGAREIVLGLGGSATTDAGAGMLSALGFKILDVAGAMVAPGGGGLQSVASVDVSGVDPRLADVVFTVASDVNNPLCGDNGAAAVYGPQKGATEEQVPLLDEALGAFAELVEAELAARISKKDVITENSDAEKQPGDDVSRETSSLELAKTPGAGAAGGLGFAALVLGKFAQKTELRPGVDIAFELTGFDEKLPDADIVITGEGKLDSQTLSGKGPAGVAHAAHQQGKTVYMICGANTLTPEQLKDNGIAGVYAVLDTGVSLEESLANPRPHVVQLARELGKEVAKQ